MKTEVKKTRDIYFYTIKYILFLKKKERKKKHFISISLFKKSNTCKLMEFPLKSYIVNHISSQKQVISLNLNFTIER